MLKTKPVSIFECFCYQEFESVCSILAAILNIGDLRLETDFHSHIGEVSMISNRDLIDDGR